MTVPKIRSGQLITTFGIGSIVDTPEWSGMIAGQEFWLPDRLNVIHEPRLQRKIGVSEFKAPKAYKPPRPGQAEVIAVPAVRFPLWHFCPACRRLADIRQFGGIRENICRLCSTKYDEKRLIPARFVVACEDGHITDFPWHWWIHRGAACLNSSLEINSTGRSTTLTSIVVSCTNCKRFASLERVFDPGELAPIRCEGWRPWLRDETRSCGKRLTAVQRGASNVYFPVTESAVSIPPFSSSTAKLIEKHWASLSLFEDPEQNRTLLEGIARKECKEFNDVWTAYQMRKDYGVTGPSPDIRLDEFSILSDPPSIDDKDDFAAEAVDVPEEFPWISRVVLVHRLRVVTVLREFSRLQASSSSASKLAKDEQDWRPAMEVHGEGIFIRPQLEALEAWKLRGGDELIRRVQKVERRRLDLIAKGLRTYQDPITPELLLLHTLSHVLMRALILDCGYSSAALREILYVRPETSVSGAMNGLLIYTAAADSEGSLGGLVHQGEPGRLGSLLFNAIETARWCSNDPLCIESEAQGTNSLNLSSCHSCSLVPETACELFNNFLDRAVLVGTQKNSALGFIPA